MASSTSSSSGRSSTSQENTAKNMVSDQISQAVLSTSNLLHLMRHSSPSQAQLTKLPKNLLLKSSKYQEHWTFIGADASSNFFPGCTYGNWVARSASSANCNSATCKYGKLSSSVLLHKLVSFKRIAREKTNLQKWNNDMHCAALIEDFTGKS